MTSQAISGLPAWLHMLAQVYPPQSVALVGAGNGTGPLVQWLQSQASQAGQGAPAVTLLEPHAPSMAQLAKRLAGTEASAEWRLLPELLAPEQGEHTYHQYTLAAENGLLPPEALHPLWPSLQLQSQEQAATVALAQLLPAGWLLMDCLPAAHLLQGTHLPASTQVVLARVVLSDAAPAGSSLANMQALLAESGFKAVATFAERNSGLGKALFVRDPKGLQDHIDQALAKAQALEADKAQLTDAKDKALAQVQLLAQEKAQAQQRCDELAKAKQAEAQARAAEQQAKEQALDKAKDLEADKAQLTDAKDKALAQVQQLAQEKAQALQRCDELDKAKETEAQARAAEQQSKEQALTNAKAFESEKAQLQKQTEELTKQLAVSKESLKDLENRLRNDMSKGLTNAVKQLEAFQRIRDFLGTVDGLGDFHGWPISPDIGLFLLERMREQHYDLIIEFGSGTSTALFAQAAQVLEQQGKATTQIVTFEHDTVYHAKTQQLLKARGLEGRVRLKHAPLMEWRDGDASYLYYDCQATLAELAQQSVSGQLRILVLVDGPPGATCQNARYPAVPMVFSALARHHIDVVLDDASRPEEKQVIELWKSFWKHRSCHITEHTVPSEKGIYLATPQK
jgi:hypothetical protein